MFHESHVNSVVKCICAHGSELVQTPVVDPPCWLSVWDTGELIRMIKTGIDGTLDEQMRCDKTLDDQL